MTGRRTPWLGLFGRRLILDVLQHISICAAAGMTLFIAVDLVETGNLASADAAAKDLLQLQLYNLPQVLEQLAGVCALLGTLTALSAQLRRGEVVAMFSAGASPAALLRPMLIAGLFLALFQACLIELIVPKARLEVSALRRKLGLPTRGSSVSSINRRNTWFRGRSGLYRVQDLQDESGSALVGVLMIRLEKGRLIERWDIDRLLFEKEGWIAEGVLHRAFDDGVPQMRTRRLSSITVDLEERPEDFVRSIGAPSRMSYGALWAAVDARERLGQPSIDHRLELYRRHTGPLSILLAALLSAALALRLGARPGLAMALGIGSLSGFSLWLSGELGMALGSTAALPPLIAAHISTLLLLLLAVFLWRRAFQRGIA